MPEFRNSGDFRGAVVIQGSQLRRPVFEGPVHLQLPVSVAPPTSEELHAAEGRFAGMPLDEIPAPAAVANGSYIPVRHNPLFVGRGEDLMRLAAIIRVGEAAAVTG